MSPRLLDSSPPVREHEHAGPSYRQGATVVRMTLVLLVGFGVVITAVAMTRGGSTTVVGDL
jgi:hypothetical protein